MSHAKEADGLTEGRVENSVSHIPHHSNPHNYVPPPTLPPPPTPTITSVNGTLTENETTIILKSTLLPHHLEDANILRFISAYIRTRSAPQAAKEAGLNTRDGNYLRGRPDIHNAITKLTAKSVMKYGFDASEVVERVKEISAMDPIEFENPDGSYKTRMSEIAPESRRGIKKFRVRNTYGKDPNGMDIKTGEIIEVEMYDKLKSLELLGREKDLFKETKQVQHDVTARMADVLLDSKRRAEDHMRDAIDVTPIALAEKSVKPD